MDDFNDFLIHRNESTQTSEISSPITIKNILIYGIQIIFLIQLLMVILNYSRDWKDEKAKNQRMMYHQVIKILNLNLMLVLQMKKFNLLL